MRERRHIASLDGLRGITALAVVMAHVYLVFPALGPLPLPDIGSGAVAIFFAISGFLMAYLYGDRPFSRKNAADFLVNRFARIYPVYLAAVLLVVVLSAVLGLGYIDPITGPFQIVRHIVMLGSTGVLWTIPPEIQFYLVFPFIWMFLANPVRYQWIAVLIGCLLAIDGLLGFPGSGILLISKLPYFLLGVLAGYLHPRLQSAARGITVGVMAILLPAFLLSHRALSIEVSDTLWGMSTALAAALSVLLVAREHPISAALFASRPFRFLGTISFSLYLLHVPCLFLTAKLLAGMPLWLVIPIGCAVALAVATASYHVIEAPCRIFLVNRWKRRNPHKAELLTST
jgi:peptidoglycan/LPS O-acetylase OafA/YrhL